MFLKKKKISNRSPQSVSTLLERLLNDKDVRKKSDSVSFLKDWVRVVGPEYEKFCKPKSLNKGVLTIEAIDAAYIQELSLQQNVFKKNITEMGFSGSVAKIKFVSGNPRTIKE